MNDSTVLEYLRSNPTLLEDFIVSSEVSDEKFERWAVRRAIKFKKNRKNSPQSAAWNNPDLSMKRRVILEMASKRTRIMFEIAQCCGQIIGTDSMELIVQNDDGAFSCRKSEDGELKLKKVKKGKRADYIQSIVNAANQTIGELHFHSPISTFEKSIINTICTWAAASNYFAELYSHKNLSNDLNDIHENIEKQRKLSNFLLDVARSIFHDIVSMDAVIIKIMNFAQKLVNADRASLFLVDAKNKQIYARIFDVGTGDEEHVRVNSDGQKEIRFDISKGIAGFVASSGDGLNIENAYEDERFNADVDSKTGYTTKTILCMPIFIRGVVIGVVQMLNKKEGVFTKQDEDAFEIFAVYCGLALHHAKLYDKIRRSEQKYRVALEVLAYHSVCNDDEVKKLKKMEIKQRVVELETIDFNGMRLSELEKPLYAIYMFRKLFSNQLKYETDDLTRFVLTVRKNYRRVSYHNWAHGWSVAHAMFVLLDSNPGVFSKIESLALYVSCLCHDLDHRGKNNAYMKTMGTPLAEIYTTSVMERHHFNQTITILQQEGHNILKTLSSEEYKQTLSLIKHCILATDLVKFFDYKKKLSSALEEKSFDIQDHSHRLYLQAIVMTGCDLVASAKPWSIQTETVKVIFQEFYEQGDAELQSGQEPIPMMDRSQAHLLPQMQVGFMRGICMPCYELISKVIPSADRMRRRCEYNTKKWEEIAESQKKIDEEKK